ncbi:DNA primase [Candidatus Azobacteroides pseudotrichonymphae]|uniref:DNA primase n=1 Tax=Azobacteroides pseudotrichonymphae genomovar. CFP2 TaxID=511995 RepID=B6YR82_AZOPC|nr:DNA primase [Candidatus Azobacteroides pseudotrichonymphae]BAG83704.1 DNA primase [Candidatus Azobacteroides pseudotrichonymphae genomovar. CFP2]
MIDSITIERIQSASQIYEVVSDFVTLKKRGVNYVGICPFHEDNTPSLYVSPAKNLYKCFACGEGGTAIHFVMKYEQLSYPEALQYLAKKYGIEFREIKMSNEQKQIQNIREAMFILNSFAQKTFSTNLFDTKEGQSVGLSYFRKRNFRKDIIQKFQLGYADSQRDSFTQTAIRAGYKQEYLKKTGLSIIEKNYTIDRFRERVIFPIHTLSGKIVAFGGRILKKEEKVAKYVNSLESEIYHKSNELYGIYFARQAIVKYDQCYLVEGYTDVISMHQAGIENVVASAGTALTQGQIRLIRRFTKNITVLYDRDTAGIKAALRSINLLLETGLNIKTVLLPEGEDPDSFSQKQSATSFNNYIKKNETDFVRFKVELLMQDAGNDPIKKVQILTETVYTIALIPEEITRLIYVKECSYLLDIDERLLMHNVEKKREELFLQKKKNDKLQLQKTEQQNTINNLPSLEHNLNLSFPFYEYETNIMYYVVRYGEQYFYYEYEDEGTNELISANLNVIEFIVSDLEEDEIELHYPLYRKMLKEGYEWCKKNNFIAEEYYKNHSDIKISHFAVDISTDKYIESKVFSQYKETKVNEEKLKTTKQSQINKMLLKEIPYVMLNYKNAILKHRVETINKQIKLAEKGNNFDKQKELISQLSGLLKTKKVIALRLRERIITKL